MRARHHKLVALVLALAAACVFAGSARASVPQPIAVLNVAHVPMALLDRIEADVQWEVNGPVRRWYPRVPRISFTPATPGVTPAPGVWLVEVLPPAEWPSSMDGDLGYHGYNTVLSVIPPSNYTPSAEVMWPTETFTCKSFVCIAPGVQPPFAYTFAHEVVEMAANPSGTGTEICDPVEYRGWRRDGAEVVAFIEPTGKMWSYRRHHRR